jgi:hypothetical protein
MPWHETIASAQYSSGRLEHAGGGDADVYTQPGRTTLVTLETSNIRPAEDWRSVYVDVYYSVKEMRKNNTFLRWRGTAELPIPIDATRHRVLLRDVRNYQNSWYVQGKVHDALFCPRMIGHQRGLRM